MYRRRNQVQELMICMIDLLSVLLSFGIAGTIRYESFSFFINYIELPSAIAGVCLIHVVVFYVMKIYEGLFARGPLVEIRKVIQYDIFFMTGLTAYIFITKNTMEFSRLTVFFMLIFNFVFIVMIHQLVKYYMKFLYKKKGKSSKVLIITSFEEAEGIINSISNSTEWNSNICGVVLMDYDGKQDRIGGISIVGNQDNYLRFVKKNVVDEVFIHTNGLRRNEKVLKRMILELEKMGIVVQLNIDIFDLGVNDSKQVYRLGQYYVVAFSSRFIDYRLVIVKRIIDIIGSVIGLILTVVVTLFLAPILLLESKGTLIFKQKRVGKNGRIFNFYKFRSMYSDAEARKSELMEQNEMTGGMFKMANDPRITKVGKFIRKTSIDELPQFWNVLKGDMSLVGTRPPTVDEYVEYESHQKRRISIKPGITGLWQISGRSNIKDFEEVVELDLKYIDSWTVGLDIKILLKTVGAVFKGSGAK